VTLELRLIDEPAAQAILSGRCPEGFACATDFPGEGDRVAAGMFLERCAAGVDPRPFGVFLVCLAAVGAYRTTDSADFAGLGLVVGGIGFHGDPDEEGRVEIGYGIVASQRRNGYATQALHRLVERARGLGAATLIAETERENEPSQGVLRKVGFVRFAEDERAVWFELALGRP
jgi:RimJ/RimL family protein N-acetyltransferase